MRRVWLITIILLAPPLLAEWTAGVARADTISHERAVALFEEANTLFDEAVEQRTQDQDASDRKLKQSIERWRTIVEGGTENGYLYYNIGNAYLLMNDLGQAVLNYRRAQRLIPGDHLIRANLAEARRRVRTKVEVEASTRMIDALLFWHHDVPARWRFRAFAVLFAAGWLLGVLRLVRGGGVPRWPMIAVIALALFPLGSLVADEAIGSRNLEGVVVSDVTGRKGPSTTGYEPSFSDPLAPGVELHILERRPDWILVELRDGRQTWLPRSAVSLI